MSLRSSLACLSVLLAIGCIVAPPVTKNKQPDEKNPEDPDGASDFNLPMHYHRYLREVISTLESDPQFKHELEKADVADIRSGKIAEMLEFVPHRVRSKLDELKRFELDRLRSLTKRLHRTSDPNAIDHEDPNHGHVDHSNPNTFEITDLKKLIAKTTEDIAAADQMRRGEFKQYEMQKEYEKMQKLNHTGNVDEREKLEKEYHEREEKHKQHEKLHQPGHKAQLEEVWEEQDHMGREKFNPRTFFAMHDLDSNGLLDHEEIKALFVKELDKMYSEGAPEDDMRERYEEMERMREQVFAEIDTNRDNFISYPEFIEQTKRQEFQRDNGWKGLDEQAPYTNDELQQYIQWQQAHGNDPHAQYPPPAHAAQGFGGGAAPQQGFGGGSVPHQGFANAHQPYQPVDVQQGYGGAQMHFPNSPPFDPERNHGGNVPPQNYQPHQQQQLPVQAIPPQHLQQQQRPQAVVNQNQGFQNQGFQNQGFQNQPNQPQLQPGVGQNQQQQPGVGQNQQLQQPGVGQNQLQQPGVGQNQLQQPGIVQNQQQQQQQQQQQYQNVPVAPQPPQLVQVNQI